MPCFWKSRGFSEFTANSLQDYLCYYVNDTYIYAFDSMGQLGFFPDSGLYDIKIQVDGVYKYLVFDEGYDFDGAMSAYIKSIKCETPILSDVSVSDWKGYGDAFTMTFNVISKNGTDSYKIVSDGVDSYKVVLAGSSIVETQTLTLQPINR